MNIIRFSLFIGSFYLSILHLKDICNMTRRRLESIPLFLSQHIPNLHDSACHVSTWIFRKLVTSNLNFMDVSAFDDLYTIPHVSS